ncbi:Beta-carotene isomerase D27 chloroplastic [Bienertia sinuspersici]
MDTNLLESTVSHAIFAQSHSKCKHHNKIVSLKPSNYKVLEVPIVHKLTCYRDKWLDVVAINHLSHNLQAAAGIQVEKEGYDGLLEACKLVTANFNPLQQQQLCLEGLYRSIPNQIFPLLKALVPPSKFTRELLAKFTGLFFAWLVGPSEVIFLNYVDNVVIIDVSKDE